MIGAREVTTQKSEGGRRKHRSSSGSPVDSERGNGNQTPGLPGFVDGKGNQEN